MSNTCIQYFSPVMKRNLCSILLITEDTKTLETNKKTELQRKHPSNNTTSSREDNFLTIIVPAFCLNLNIYNVTTALHGQTPHSSLTSSVLSRTTHFSQLHQRVSTA